MYINYLHDYPRGEFQKESRRGRGKEGEEWGEREEGRAGVHGEKGDVEGETELT